MDDVVNRFARELADAIAAAVAENPQVEACREKARAAGFEMKVTLEAVVGFVNRSQPRGAGEGAGASARCRAADARPFEVTANDRRFLRSLRIAADETQNRERRSELTKSNAQRNRRRGRSASSVGLFYLRALRLVARRARPRPPPRPDRRGSSGAAASAARRARRPAECRSGCSARRSSASEMLSRYLTSARRLLPCAAISTRLPALDRRRDRLVPVRQEPRDGVLQRLGQRSSAGIEPGVARIARRMPRIVRRQRRRRDVVAAAPDLDLRFAVLRRRLRLVQPLQRAVVPLVQPPALDRPESTSGPARRA